MIGAHPKPSPSIATPCVPRATLARPGTRRCAVSTWPGSSTRRTQRSSRRLS